MVSMDLRQAALEGNVLRYRQRMAIIAAVTLLAMTGLVCRAQPDRVETKVRTVTVTREVAPPPEPAIRDEIGAMTVREFRYIQPGMSAVHVDQMFGSPPGNVDNDRRTFYPAVGGGKYWVYYDNAEDQKVTRTEYGP